MYTKKLNTVTVLKLIYTRFGPEQNAAFTLSQHDEQNPVLRIRIRIGSGFNQVSESGNVFGIWIRVRIQEDKNDPRKKEKIKKFHVLKCWMFSFES
jgi:hypothetical protein